MNSYGSSVASTTKVALAVAPPQPSLLVTAGASKVKFVFSYATSSTTEPFGQVSDVDVFEGTAPGGESATKLAASSYTLQVGHDFQGTPIYTVTVKGLSSGTPYYFTLAAVGPGGTSPLSSEVTATPS
jgi:hypothetical protein